MWAQALAQAGHLDLVGNAEPAEHYLWPDNLRAWQLWCAAQTQWRAGMGGRTGLDYAGVRALLDEEGLEPGDERRDIFTGIRACEAAVLEVWHEQAEREEDERRAAGGR